MNGSNVAVISTDKSLERAKRALASIQASQYFQKDGYYWYQKVVEAASPC